MYPTGFDGSPLNAEYTIEADEPFLSLVLESAGGKTPHGARNSDYRAALLLLLIRLAAREAALVDALVDSSVTQSLADPDRRVMPGPSPILLTEHADLRQVRRELMSRQGRIGQKPGTQKAGNNSKRLRLQLAVPGYKSADASRLEADLAVPVSTVQLPSEFTTPAIDLLRHLIGEPLSTIDGMTNRILGIRSPHVLVATAKSPEGKPVAIKELDDALRELRQVGSVAIRTDEVGHRSTFIGTVLRTLPSVRADANPQVITVGQHDTVPDQSTEPGSEAARPFLGGLDRTGSVMRRGEQRSLRATLLRGRGQATCTICGDTYPERFLWASHIKKRSLCTDQEKRDIPNVAMLACLFGCDALFEDGYLSVNGNGQIAITDAANLPPAIAIRLKMLAGRTVLEYTAKADYFAWHHTNQFRG